MKQQNILEVLREVANITSEVRFLGKPDLDNTATLLREVSEIARNESNSLSVSPRAVIYFMSIVTNLMRTPPTVTVASPDTETIPTTIDRYSEAIVDSLQDDDVQFNVGK